MKRSIFILLTILSLSVVTFSCASTKAEPEPKAEPVKEKTSVKSSADLEYERATKELVGEVVSRDEYELDKKIIMSKISELNEIMKSKDYKSWINYIEPNSIDYWSRKTNLSSISKQLPVKGLSLKTLQDYFNYVFIPSRMNRKIDEIRYISSKSIKAVQVKGDDIIIYYNFKKINGEWLVELPTL